MSETFTYPEVTGEILQEAVGRILEVGSPIKIVLFGSRGRGEARTESDVDFLIIEESDLPRYERPVPYYRALKEAPFAKDIVVWTPSEIEEWSQVSNAFITTALREGSVLYERPD